MARALSLLVLVVLVAVAVPVEADPTVPPVLSGTYDEATATVVLSWQAWTPGGAFRIYENGVPVAETTATTYAAPVTGTLQVFQVAVLDSGEDGALSNPFAYVPGPLDCPLLSVSLLPFGYNIAERCIPPVGARGCYVVIHRLEPPIDYTVSSGCPGFP